MNMVCRLGAVRCYRLTGFVGVHWGPGDGELEQGLRAAGRASRPRRSRPRAQLYHHQNVRTPSFIFILFAISFVYVFCPVFSLDERVTSKTRHVALTVLLCVQRWQSEVLVLK